MATALFDLPGDCLALVLVFGAPADAARVNCVSRAARAAMDRPLWERVSREMLRRFVPARAFFDAPANASYAGFDGRTARGLFPVFAARADAGAAALCAAAGAPFAGAEWTWREEPLERAWSTHWQIMCGASVRVRPGGDGGGGGARGLRVFVARSALEYADWAVAFHCGDCFNAGAAARQCASCAKPLCGGCGARCGVVDDARNSGARGIKADTLCPFALCGGCAARLSITDHHPLRADILAMPAPGLFAPVCSACPLAARCCLAHVDACVLECHACGTTSCVTGTTAAHVGSDDDFVVRCMQPSCWYTSCGKAACSVAGRRIVREWALNGTLHARNDAQYLTSTHLKPFTRPRTRPAGSSALRAARAQTLRWRCRAKISWRSATPTAPSTT
jgi:hypothetical protein